VAVVFFVEATETQLERRLNLKETALEQYFQKKLRLDYKFIRSYTWIINKTKTLQPLTHGQASR
jgi:hypothetical protein